MVPEERVFLPGPIGPVTVPGQVVIAVVTPRIVEEIGPGAETVAVDHPSGGLGGSSRHINAACRHESPQIVLLSALFYQVLVGPLDSEEHHHQAGWEQLPEEEDDPEDDVGLTADLLHVSLMDRGPVDTSVL